MASSESEGEIVERAAGKLKVPEAQPLSRASSVNPTSRNSRASLSTSPSASPPVMSRDRDHDRDRNRTRDRSRSPYHRRGEKRRHMAEEEFGGSPRRDPRRHVPRYEDSRQRTQVSYADIDHSNDAFASRLDDYGRERDRDRERERDRPHDKRQRTRSRSPYYRSKDFNRTQQNRHDSKPPSSPRNGVNDDRNGYKKRDLAREGNRQFRGGDELSRRGEFSRNGNGQNSRDGPANGSSERQRRFGASNESRTNIGRSSNNLSVSFANDVPLPTEAPPPENQSLDETALIEDRRLKRQAIKARLKTQPGSSLNQELQLSSESGHSTPTADRSDPLAERSVSPTLQSPKTPLRESVPGSPMEFIVQNEDELANHASVQAMEVDGDFQSAADYDPTEDTQEDRLREEQQHHIHEVPAASFDETKEAPEHVLLPESKANAPPPAKKTKDDYDMFADDLDDDMFAPESETKSAHEPSKAVPITQGKEYDAGLLDNWDDPEGYYRIMIGELLDKQFEVKEKLGKGVFSNVVRAINIQTGGLVAIKIIRNNETMYKAGLKEIEILRKLKNADPDDKKHLIRFEADFVHKGHLCMVFENLKDNLREVLKQFGRNVGLSLKAVRSYAQQMLLGLSLLKRCSLLHADLKPDNILVNGDHTVLKLCDLGSAADVSEATEPTAYLASRFYRAPEVILGCSYDYAIDVWSIGCTLFELYTAKILFTGSSNNQMLRAIMECRGKISMKMLKKGEYSGKHFDDNGDFRSQEKDKITHREVVRIIRFNKPTRDLRTRIFDAARKINDVDPKELDLFSDLLDKCLTLNPERRITPNEALRHPFFSHHRKL